MTDKEFKEELEALLKKKFQANSFVVGVSHELGFEVFANVPLDDIKELAKKITNQIRYYPKLIDRPKRRDNIRPPYRETPF